MDRRQFCQSLFVGVGLGAAAPLFALEENQTASVPVIPEKETKLIQVKIDNFDKNFPDDIYLDAIRMQLLKTTLERLTKIQSAVGFGKFNLLSFDELLKAAVDWPEIGAFGQEELAFIEDIFFTDAKRYGFYGEKVINKLTQKIPNRETLKIAGSGHYLFRGKPQAMYQKIIKDVGSDIVLTSGIRSVVKQLYLFLAKAQTSDGNLSRASRSLAPPGHSFHGVSDFDVGKIGWGYRNFTEQFAESDVFKRLTDLGYVDIRYTRTNSFGVRFEPWHIKVA